MSSKFEVQRTFKLSNFQTFINISKKISIGIIGIGNMGKNHLRVLDLLKDVDVVFAYDPDPQKRQLIREQYPQVLVVDTLDNTKKTIDAIVIAAPTQYHYDYIAQFAGKAKNIFVEKPMTATVEEAHKVKALQVRYKFNLMVGFIERFNPAMIEVKKMINGNQVINVDITRTNKLSARITDVDVVSDLMIHDIDLATYLNGPVKSISAQGFMDGNMIGFANATLIHDNGAISRLQASRVTDKKDRCVKVTCRDMYIDCDLLRKEIIVNRQSQIVDMPDKPYTIQSIQENVSVKLEEALLLEHQAFVHLCKGRSNGIVPDLQAGLNSVEICSAIQHQIMNG